MTDLVLVKKLREETGCGISDCSKALASCGGNYPEAVTWLRKKGLASALKKSTRAATEGLIGICNMGKIASLVEVNSETDFVAANTRFQKLVLATAQAALQVKDSNDYVEKVKEQTVDGQKLANEFSNSIAVIGENLQLRRGKTLEVKGAGLIASYMHNRVADNLGKMGVLVVLKSEADSVILGELGKQLAMQIAAAKPEFISDTDVPAVRLETEKSILREQTRSSGKPEAIVEKMIAGRVKKFYEENCLLSQNFILEENKKVADVLKDFAKKYGKTVEILEYALFILGEGLEHPTSNFVAEVKSLL